MTKDIFKDIDTSKYCYLTISFIEEHYDSIKDKSKIKEACDVMEEYFKILGLDDIIIAEYEDLNRE